MNISKHLAACAALSLLAAAPVAARAETMNWSFQSFSPHVVHVRFFSQNRSAVWPGGAGSWELDDYLKHPIPISCLAGEQICYGAWTGVGSYWGVGEDGSNGCTNCCYTCGGGDPDVKLNSEDD